MSPVRYLSAPDLFAARQDQLNAALSFAGLMLNDEGRLAEAESAATINEARARANRLRSALEDRGVHRDVLAACRPELVDENYFHAVLEAAKSVAEKLRERSGLSADGVRLVQEALELKRDSLPILAFNSLESDSERSEHRGLMSLFKGLFETFRNPTAHEPKASWSISEQDALDILTLASMLHRRIDDAIRTDGAS